MEGESQNEPGKGQHRQEGKTEIGACWQTVSPELTPGGGGGGGVHDMARLRSMLPMKI